MNTINPDIFQFVVDLPSTCPSKIVFFSSDEDPPIIEKIEPGIVYVWFRCGKMHILQRGTWVITPYII
jgi:hypothetical protein